MKPRTVAQLKKLIAEGLEKSPHGIARLDISEEEFIECAEKLSKWASSMRWNFTFRAAPFDLVNDPLIELKPRGTHGYRIAMVDMDGLGWKTPKPFYVSEDCPSRANAETLADEIQEKYPDAMLFVFPAEKQGSPNYWMTHYCVRVVHVADWLRHRFPMFTTSEAISYLAVVERQLPKTAGRYCKGSHSRGEKTRAIILAAYKALMSDPEWRSAKRMAFVSELMRRTGKSERTIYEYIPSRSSTS